MNIGVPKEIKDNEARVGVTPAGVKALAEAGHRVLVETQAGALSGFPDAEYQQAGAEIAGGAGPVWEKSDIVVKVKEPIEHCPLDLFPSFLNSPPTPLPSLPAPLPAPTATFLPMPPAPLPKEAPAPPKFPCAKLPTAPAVPLAISPVPSPTPFPMSSPPLPISFPGPALFSFFCAAFAGAAED